MFRVPDIRLRAIVESASPVRCERGRVFVTRLFGRIKQATRCLGENVPPQRSRNISDSEAQYQNP